MDIRDAVNFEYYKRMDTAEMRKNFLIQDLFKKDSLNLTYSYYDRMIVGGISPTKPIKLTMPREIIGGDYLLERREAGIINIGAKGDVTIDGKAYTLDKRDAIYIGRGAKEVVFSSADAKTPAKFYLNSTPAHATHPTTQISIKDATPQNMGEESKNNKRTIYKFIHPDGVKSCQLVMGMTLLDKPSIWNSMPCHTHPRRIEAYFYFDIPGDDIVFHFMGKPEETRHLILRNEEAILSPSWSIHTGVGTFNYSFIWGMGGENQTFTDMDAVPMKNLM
ncbi:MAG: 5-dehydro-4-deoxy-D-glucuronate isomerase [Spirochaetaceae bacterium]|nr:MAG: 5-dehydro-4-deoxy-D-glucuronate isomerase [Spirochaetaceae bacterium]